MREHVAGLARRLGAAVGLRGRTLGSGVWLLERPRAGGPRLTVRRIGRQVWVVQRRRRRVVRQIGPPSLRCHLVVDEAAARADRNRLQGALGTYLAREQIMWVLDALGINCVLDVGANRGQYASMLRRAGYTGRIVSFEPLSHLVEQLLAAAEDDPLWTVVPVALGSEDTQGRINVVPGTMSSMRQASDFGRSWSQRLGDSHAETIEIRRLDGLFDQVTEGIEDPRVFLKMDTQGFDLETFRGAGDRLPEVLGLQSELACVPIYDGMPRMPEQLTCYEAAGFEVTGMFPVSRDRETLRVIEYDTVMVRPDEVLAHRARTGHGS